MPPHPASWLWVSMIALGGPKLKLAQAAGDGAGAHAFQ